MKKYLLLFIFSMLTGHLLAQPALKHDLTFDHLALSWDEAIPLGNGMLGALIWQKGDHLRFSLDRSDLWDLRPMKGLHRKEFSYQWVYEQVKKKDYAVVQQYFDAPYDKEAAPSKIPGGALEFNTTNWGKVSAVHLYLKNALCEVKWKNGVVLKTFVQATQPLGWFRFENISTGLTPVLVAPAFQRNGVSPDSLKGSDLARLGYAQGSITQKGKTILYHQPGWNGFSYDITVKWKYVNIHTIEGVWSVSSNYKKESIPASVIVDRAITRSFGKDLLTHNDWWKNFWNRSNLHVPDSLLEIQWYRELYKFGSATRKGAPPILLQGVWTADNGKLPPWKGDYHHDLNTELSYWPAYSANHLEEAMAYLDHLDENLPNYKRYTKLYFKTDGIAVPGVTTLDGTEMGGWIQYALSPTVSAWLAQHYYLQWKYSMDRQFLKQRAYPWMSGVAKHLEQLTFIDEKGLRKLPISSSPEINNNNLEAWFLQNTNYDLALLKFVFAKAEELARELHLESDAVHWKKIASELGDYALSPNNELLFSPSLAYTQSHRHFSNAMAIHPLGMIQWEDGDKSRSIIKNTLHLYDSIGPANWNGYSYSWLANLKARAKDGEGAAKALQTFAKAFCSVNSFHVNGDQTKSGSSTRTYRPFTLEGNFAFAAGLQEMLLQSYAGFIEIMPAIPKEWKDITFEKLRTEGAFLVSAKKEKGSVKEVKISAEKGGIAKLKLPFTNWHITHFDHAKVMHENNGFIELFFQPGGVISIENNQSPLN
jgi:alpha-L-fucosidase 2